MQLSPALVRALQAAGVHTLRAVMTVRTEVAGGTDVVRVQRVLLRIPARPAPLVTG